MKTIWCLFDGSGIAGLPWAQAGCRVFCFNADDANHGEYEIKMQHKNLHYVNCWIDDSFIDEAFLYDDPSLIISFPDCTAMSCSSSKHEREDEVVNESVALAKIAQRLGDMYGCPWVVENPVGKLCTKWRKPNVYIDPYEFGGYMSGFEPSFHPKMPARDGYTKITGLWFGNGFIMPEKRPVPHCGFFWGWKFLGGKSTRTKQLRSLTPRGLARAIFEANKDLK